MYLDLCPLATFLFALSISTVSRRLSPSSALLCHHPQSVLLLSDPSHQPTGTIPASLVMRSTLLLLLCCQPLPYCVPMIIINVKTGFFQSQTNFTKGFTKELLSICKGYRSKIINISFSRNNLSKYKCSV